MFERLLASLLETLRPHFDLSKTRLETLAVLLVGLANCRTVNLSHLASQFPGEAKHSSNYRRLQRFFQFVELDGDVAARLIMRMLNLTRPALLALDRTNWKLGSRDVNILMLAVVTRRFRVPLMWVLLDHAGNSATAQRTALMERYLRLFGASSIRALLADREFVGAEWMNFLNKNSVPFVIRLKEDMRIRMPDGIQWQFRTLLRKPRRGTWEGWLTGMDTAPENRLRFAAKRIKGGEALIVATNLDEAGPGPLSQTLGDRMYVCRCQNTRAEPRRYPHHWPHKTRHPARAHSPCRHMGLQVGNPRSGKRNHPPKTPWQTRKVMVQNWPRRLTKMDHPFPTPRT